MIYRLTIRASLALILLLTAQVAWSLQWEIETIDTGWRTGYGSSIAVDRQGNANIAYYDYSKQLIKYASKSGSTWTTQTIDDCYQRSETSPALIFDANGKPNILYENPSQGLSLATQTSGSSWTTQDIPGVGLTYACYSMALDGTGRFHVSNTTMDGGLNYAVSDGATWNAQSLPISGSSYNYCPIAVNNQGDPYVAYRTPGATGSLMCAQMVGGVWSQRYVGPSDGGDGRISMVMDGQGRPHICYKKWSGALVYSFWSGSSWVQSTLPGVNRSSTDCSMTLDSNGNPYITYTRASDESLWLAHWDGITWTDQLVTNMCYGISNNLLDDSGRMHITYYGKPNGNLVYATALVPEPSCLAALLIGLTGCMVLRRRCA